MKARTTQAMKLAEVLKHGRLSSKSYDDIRADAICIDPDHCLYSLDERLAEIQDYEDRGLTYWEFNPSDLDWEKIAQYSKDPFTLVDIVLLFHS